MPNLRLRNIAIIAHVDHGKTTLVDKLLQQSGTLDERTVLPERAMDSDALEKERGITILAKNTALQWRGYRINIVDTPGHADFGGEVERVLSMVDSVLLLVDAVEGPMPQTRFVTQKALARGFEPIVVINKIDRAGARPDWILTQTFDLFDRLGATDEQLDFPVVYASALRGYAGFDAQVSAGSMEPLLQTIIDHVAPPAVDANGPLQMQISALDYDTFVGVVGIGRISRGVVRSNSPVKITGRDSVRQGRVLQILGFNGLDRLETPQAQAGDIIGVTGLGELQISDTLCDPQHVEALPPLSVDEPTMSMSFRVSTSPFAGRDGRFVSSRVLGERLQREALHNVALRVEQAGHADRFNVYGRGQLHLGILIENMRREGFELAVSRPHVVLRVVDGVTQEPYEAVAIDVEEAHQGVVMEKMGERRGELIDMMPDGAGRVRLDYVIPSRGLIGLQSEFMTATSGTGVMHHVFDHYGPHKPGRVGERRKGVMISNATGKALGYALFNLQERGRLIVGPGVEVYEGMIVGIHARDNDLVVNPLRAKQLTNIRAASSDENIVLTPPLRLSLEQALEFIDEDELLEVTPKSLRVRKKLLSESERKRASRAAK